MVQDRLEEEWSPPQIAAHLRETYPGRPEWQLCTRHLPGPLPRRRRRPRQDIDQEIAYRPAANQGRRSATVRTSRFLTPVQLIDQRPAVVEQQARMGDWEGDLIVGRASRSAIGTLVDRRTGYLRLVHSADGHAAERLRVTMLPVLTGLPALARQTLTWDQGSELAGHDVLAECFNDGISSPTRSACGCPARTRTSTGCSASTCPRAATSAGTRPPSCERSSDGSTTVLASASAGAAPPVPWSSSWQQ